MVDRTKLQLIKNLDLSEPDREGRSVDRKLCRQAALVRATTNTCLHRVTPGF